MEYAIVSIASAVVSAAVGFLAGRKYRLPVFAEKALDASHAPSHKHDLHVRGKRNGQKRMYCIICGYEEYAHEGKR